MGLGRSSQQLSIQRRGRKPIVQQLGARRHLGKQVVKGFAHILHPARIQAIPPPPVLHALGLCLPKPPNHILIALTRPALRTQQLEVRVHIRPERRDHQRYPHAGLDKLPLLLGTGRQGSEGRAQAFPTAGRNLLTEAKWSVHEPVTA